MYVNSILLFSFIINTVLLQAHTCVYFVRRCILYTRRRDQTIPPVASDVRLDNVRIDKFLKYPKYSTIMHFKTLKYSVKLPNYLKHEITLLFPRTFVFRSFYFYLFFLIFSSIVSEHIRKIML